MEVKVLRGCDDVFLLSYGFMAINERKPKSLSNFFEGGVDGSFLSYHFFDTTSKTN